MARAIVGARARLVDARRTRWRARGGRWIARRATDDDDHDDDDDDDADDYDHVDDDDDDDDGRAVRRRGANAAVVDDVEQMRALWGTYGTMWALASALVLVEASKWARGGDAGGGGTAAALVGMVVAARAWDTMGRVARGEVMAVRGTCPNPRCRERVFAFLKTRGGTSKTRAECHCCARKIVFDATFEREATVGATWGGVTCAPGGRVYLLREEGDFWGEEDDFE